MRGRKIVITGGSGYLGSSLVERFWQDGEALIQFAEKGKRIDITNSKAVEQFFTQHEPIDAVLHLASANEVRCAEDPDAAMVVNGQAAGEFLAASNAKRFIYFSTFHVYGVQEGVITEETQTKPVHPYGKTKLAGEQACSAAAKNTELVILRASNGIGVPPMHDRWTLVLFDLCRSAHEKKQLVLQTPGHQLRDFVSLDDIYAATKIILDARLDDNPVYNLGSGTTISVCDTAKIVQRAYRELYNSDIPVVAPEGEPPQQQLFFSIERLQALGFRPKTNIFKEAKATLKSCERFR